MNVVDSLKTAGAAYVGQTATPNMIQNPILNEVLKLVVAILSAALAKMLDNWIKKKKEKAKGGI